MKYLVTYDVSEDSRRNKVIKLLNEYGKRVQFSCFEIEISPQILELLVFNLEKVIDQETDKIFIFPLSKNSVPFIKKLGKLESEGDISIVL